MEDPKNNTARSFAEEGLEAVNEEAPAAEAALPASGTPVGADEEEELVQVGGLEPVEFFYRFNAPKKTPKNPYKVLTTGETIEGTFVRTFVSGKFKNGTHLIRLKETGKLVGFPGSGSIDKAMSKVAEGARIKIRYDGMSEIKQGQWKGSNAHNATVLASKLKPS